MQDSGRLTWVRRSSRKTDAYPYGRLSGSVEFVEELTTNLEGGRQTDVIILDFATAVDRVNHSLLVHKLQFYGIRGSTITWIANFLSNRRQTELLSTVPESESDQEYLRGPFLAPVSSWPTLMTCQ